MRRVLLSLFVSACLIKTASALTHITNCVELQAMRNNLSEDYVLDNDIDCSETVNWNGGDGFLPIGNNLERFTGNFDGQGHKIVNLYITRSSLGHLGGGGWAQFVGLFGVIQFGTVKNVGLVNVTVRTNVWYTMVGALAGCSHGTVSNCYSTGSVSGDSGVGGLVGSNYFGTISKCYSTADVTAYGVNAGGLVGTNEFKVISDSYATGSVGTQSAPGSGGFCGANNATILNCYSTGRTYGGGLVGWCNGTATNSYWDMETSEKDWSAAGEGKTTGQMKHQSTFNGWDFVNTWTIQEGLDYPRLVWEAGPPIVKDFYLHGVAPALTLDNVAPTGTTPKYKDSPSINRTTYKEVGTWTFVVPLGTTATIDSLADIRTWIGLKNSDDQGTYFDLCAELAKNGTLIGFGETTNIQGVTRNADKAKEVTVGFGSISDRNLAAGDTLSLRILTKVTAAGGHSSAVGLRLYYDALSRPSRLTPSPTP